MNPALAIVRAAPADAPALTEIALAAKRHWGYPARWIESWRAALTVTPKYIAAESVYLARDGVPAASPACGFYSFLHLNDGLWLDHFWVHPAHMGRGLGRALFQHAVETASSLGASAFKIEADPNAEGFYLRMGAARTGERITEIEGRRRVLPLLTLQIQPRA